MCRRLLCQHSADHRVRAVFFYVCAWCGWLLGGFELGLTLATDEPFIGFLGIASDRQSLLLAGLLAAHAAAAAAGGVIAGRWADSVVETRALVISAAVPQLLGAMLYFFAATLPELVLAHLLAGLGSGAAVAMLAELLRMAPLRARVSALAGLSLSHELGAAIGPSVAVVLDTFPDLPTDVFRHRVTPWNAAGLLLVICHLVYLLLLAMMYPNLTFEREVELLEIRDLMYPSAAAASAQASGDEGRAATHGGDEADREVAALSARMLPAGECRGAEAAPDAPGRPPTPSGKQQTAARDLAEIGRAFAAPDTPVEPLLPRTEPSQPRIETPPLLERPPPLHDTEQVVQSDTGQEPPGEAGKPGETEQGAQTPAERQPPVGAENGTGVPSQPKSSDAEKAHLEVPPDPSRVDTGVHHMTPTESVDPSLLARRWPASQDLTVAAPDSPHTPHERSGWYTPDEVPRDAGPPQEYPHDPELYQEHSGPSRPGTPWPLNVPELPADETDRPLEGPYANAPEGSTEDLLRTLRVYTSSRRRARRVAVSRRSMLRMVSVWKRVLCWPTAMLLASCLIVYLAQTALGTVIPRETELGPMEITPRWMLGMSAVMRVFTATGLVFTVLWKDCLGALTVVCSLTIMSAAHLCLGLSLHQLHGYTYDWGAPAPPTAAHLRWASVLRVAVCSQGVGSALFEPVALALLSQLVSRTLLGRGIACWALATRTGLLLGPFWAGGLLGDALPLFLTPMAVLVCCLVVLLVARFRHLFTTRKMRVRVLDMLGPRFPMAGLGGRTVRIIGHLRQLYCSETGDAAADAEGGARVAPAGGARRPLIGAEGGP